MFFVEKSPYLSDLPNSISTLFLAEQCSLKFLTGNLVDKEKSEKPFCRAHLYPTANEVKLGDCSVPSTRRAIIVFVAIAPIDHKDE